MPSQGRLEMSHEYISVSLLLYFEYMKDIG